MKTRVAMLSAALLALTLAVPIASEARSYVVVEVAPPPPRVETVPGPRRGYAWAPGYWNWNGHRHVWVGGHYVRARGADYRWVPHHWDQHDGRYRLNEGRWEQAGARRDHGQ